MRQVGRNRGVTLSSLRNTDTAPHLGSLGLCVCFFVVLAKAAAAPLFLWQLQSAGKSFGCVSFFFFMAAAAEREAWAVSSTQPPTLCQMSNDGQLARACYKRFKRELYDIGITSFVLKVLCMLDAEVVAEALLPVRVCDLDSRPAIFVAPGKSWVEDDVRCCGSLGNFHGKAVVFLAAAPATSRMFRLEPRVGV